MSRLPFFALAFACSLAACRPSASSADAGGASDSSSASARAAVSSNSAASSDSVELRTDRRSYAVSDTLHLTIANHGHGSYSFNPCTRVVEHESPSGWEPVPEPNRMCTMVAWLLAPDSARSATTTLPSSIAAGRYRLSLVLTREGEPGRTTITSEAFDVSR